MKFKHEIALGMEVFVQQNAKPVFYCDSQQPCSVASAGTIYPSYAVDQARLCTDFSTDGLLLSTMVRTLADSVEARCMGQVKFEPTREGEKTRVQLSTVWESPEVRALTMPLHDPEEGNSHSVELTYLARSASCIVDFDVTEASPEERLLRWNLLNAVTPAVVHHVHRKYGLPRLNRHLALRYVGRPERVPTGWQWMSGWQEYQQKVLPLTQVFAATERRVRSRSVLSNGLFHFAQLLSVEGREVIRWWALPTMMPAACLFSITQLEEWLLEALPVVRAKKPRSLSEVAAALPQFQGLLIPADAASRLHLWEAF